MDDEIEVTGGTEEVEAEEVETEETGDSELEANADAQAEEEETPSDTPAEKTKEQKSIEKLAFKERQARRDAEYWRNKANEKPAPAPEPEAIKTLEDFDYDELKYQSYLNGVNQKNTEAAVDKALAKGRAEQEFDRKKESFGKQEAEFEKLNPDYQDIARTDDLTVSDAMADVIWDMDNGAAVLYYLGKNPELSFEIAGMAPMMAARELGRIEVKVEQQAKRSGKKVSDAPKPAPGIKPSNPAVKKSQDDMSQKEFNKSRRAYIAKHR